MVERLIVCIMGQNCEKFIGMCLDSVKDADDIVYCDGGSSGKDFTIHRVDEKMKEFSKGIMIENKYNQEDKTMNGKQRNFYLDYLKKNYPNDWALCLDADEVVEDLSKIKEFIQEAQPCVYSPKMRHFIGDLGHEDAAVKEHFVLNRLFKISEAGEYPLVEHPVLQQKVDSDGLIMQFRGTTIWHLAYAPNMWSIKSRYENHLKKSNMHTPEYLKQWYYAHLFGQYPVSVVNLIDIPEVIFKEFGIDKDEVYFFNRKLEVKHFLMLKNWIDYFRNETNCPFDYNMQINDYGAGLGPFGVAAKVFNCKYAGLEISKFAVKTNPFNLDLRLGDIKTDRLIEDADITLCIDILEHLDEKDLESALNTIKQEKGFYIFSIPFLGNPDLENDKTHKIKKSKEWWINQLSKHFKISEAPVDWLFSKQILIGETQ